MPPAPVPPNEAGRLAAVHAVGLLDTPADPHFDRLVRMLSILMDVPVALITVVDRQRQWFKAAIGLDARETDRDHAFCAHALAAPDLLVVPDATLDARFAENPLVTGTPGIRFYAGAPLILPGGHVMGTLCAIDRKPRQITVAERWLMTELAATVISMVELHGANLQLERTAQTDPLTGLATRTAFLDGMVARLVQARSDRCALALMVLDLDRFGAINALLGHAAGDALLRTAATALQTWAPPGSAVARFGGDRFALAMQASDVASFAPHAEACRQAVVRAVADGGWTIGASLGGAWFTEPPTDVEYALAQAEAALLAAKRAGGDREVLRTIVAEAVPEPESMVSSAA